MDKTSTNLLLRSKLYVSFFFLLLILCTPITSTWGQNTLSGKEKPEKEKPKKEKKKKAKLPPEDINGAMLANATYNFSSSGL